MKKVWTFSVFYNTAIKNNMRSGKQQKTVNMLLTGHELGSVEGALHEVSATEASRYVKDGLVGEYYRDNVSACSIDQLVERIQKIKLSDPAWCATCILERFRSGDVRISESLLREYEELLDNEKYFEVLAKALLHSVRTPTDAEADFVAAEVNEEFSFKKYYLKAEEKYGKMKTLLYHVEERPVSDFYVCNAISRSRDTSVNTQIIKNPTLEKLQVEAQYAMITGAAGLGKSMLMRHFLLDAIRSHEKADVLPILVMLRDYQGAKNSLFSMAVDAVQAIDSGITEELIRKAFLTGKVKLLLDGVDEIREREIGSFVSALNRFTSEFQSNQLVLSSRKYSSFVNLYKVVLFDILPFSKSQAIQLIKKLEYYPETPIIKADFINRLDKEYFDTHKEFASNPLLLTLMLMTFRRFSRLPRKKHIFYAEAYATLLQGHDAQNKPGYIREFLSVDDPEDFTEVFREFCARSYRDSIYEFERRELEEYYKSLRSAQKIKASQEQLRERRARMSFSNFLSDADKNTSLLFEEGGTYLFRHRSFQEYFFADYYAQADDASLIRLGNYLDKKRLPFSQTSPDGRHYHSLFFDEGEAFDMLYEMRPDKVERFVFMPFLADIFERHSDKEAYWHFLNCGYGGMSYSIIDPERLDEYNIPAMQKKPRVVFSTGAYISRILDWISSIISIRNSYYTTDVFDEFQEKLCYKDFATDYVCAMRVYDRNKKGATIRLVEVGNIAGREHQLMSDKGEPIVFGRQYKVPFYVGISNPEGYNAFVQMIEDPEFPAHEVFVRLQDYYSYLKIQYEHAGDTDTSF